MRILAGLLLFLAGSSPQRYLAFTGTVASPAAGASEPLAADTPKTTVLGKTFIAPAGWSVTVRGPATILEAPEGDSWIALVDVAAKDADAALAAGWASYKPDAKWPLKVATDQPDRDGWSQQRAFDYQASPNEKRDVAALTRYANGTWTTCRRRWARSVERRSP